MIANAEALLHAARVDDVMVAYAHADHRADRGTSARTLRDTDNRLRPIAPGDEEAHKPLLTGGTEETSHSLARLLGDDVTPHAVRNALEQISSQRDVVIFIDEFDRLQDPAGRVLFADTIKTLSDRVVRATITLIGVADSVSELVREHRSVERALAQIHMPRMTRQELSEIATRGIEAAQMGIRPDAVRRIATLSQGLPHYTQLLTQLAAQSALQR